MWKETKDKSEWKDTSCLWIRRLNIVKLLAILLSRVIYRFNIIPITIPMMSFPKREKAILKFIGSFGGCRIAKIILKKNKAEGDILPDFKTDNKATSSKQSGIGIKTDI